jgi:hypothetical protein
VYNPLPSIVPSSPEPDTDHVTASDAENCFVPPSGTLALDGVTVNAGGGGGDEFPLTDWQATITPIAIRDTHPANTNADFLPVAIPKTNPPTSGRAHSNKGERFSERLIARGCFWELRTEN